MTGHEGSRGQRDHHHAIAGSPFPIEVGYAERSAGSRVSRSVHLGDEIRNSLDEVNAGSIGGPAGFEDDAPRFRTGSPDHEIGGFRGKLNLEAETSGRVRRYGKTGVGPDNGKIDEGNFRDRNDGDTVGIRDRDGIEVDKDSRSRCVEKRLVEVGGDRCLVESSQGDVVAVPACRADVEGGGADGDLTGSKGASHTVQRVVADDGERSGEAQTAAGCAGQRRAGDIHRAVGQDQIGRSAAGNVDIERAVQIEASDAESSRLRGRGARREDSAGLHRHRTVGATTSAQGSPALHRDRARGTASRDQGKVPAKAVRCSVSVRPDRKIDGVARGQVTETLVKDLGAVRAHRGREEGRGAVVEEEAQGNPVRVGRSAGQEAVGNGIDPIRRHRVGGDGELVAGRSARQAGVTAGGIQPQRSVGSPAGRGSVSGPVGPGIEHDRVVRRVANGDAFVPEILPAGRLRVGIEVIAIVGHDAGVAEQRSLQKQGASGHRSGARIGMEIVQGEGFPYPVHHQVDVVPNRAEERRSAGQGQGRIRGGSILHQGCGGTLARQAGERLIEAVQIQRGRSTGPEIHRRGRHQSVRCEKARCAGHVQLGVAAAAAQAVFDRSTAMHHRHTGNDIAGYLQSASASGKMASRGSGIADGNKSRDGAGPSGDFDETVCCHPTVGPDHDVVAHIHPAAHHQAATTIEGQGAAGAVTEGIVVIRLNDASGQGKPSGEVVVPGKDEDGVRVASLLEGGRRAGNDSADVTAFIHRELLRDQVDRAIDVRDAPGGEHGINQEADRTVVELIPAHRDRGGADVDEGRR